MLAEKLKKRKTVCGRRFNRIKRNQSFRTDKENNSFLDIMIAHPDFSASLVYATALKQKKNRVAKVFSAREAMETAGRKDFDVFILHDSIAQKNLVPVIRKTNRNSVIILLQSGSRRKNIGMLLAEGFNYMLDTNEITPDDIVSLVEDNYSTGFKN